VFLHCRNKNRIYVRLTIRYNYYHHHQIVGSYRIIILYQKCKRRRYELRLFLWQQSRIKWCLYVFIRVIHTHILSWNSLPIYFLFTFTETRAMPLSLSLSLSPFLHRSQMKTPTLEGYETRRLKDIVKTLANASASSANARQHALPYRS